ncbi:MAG: CPBP family intramembrane glutamic endopeptidase [Cyclobacteriaceae bacterium]
MNNAHIFNILWRDKIKFNPLFGLFLIVGLGIPRFILVLNATVTGQFHYVSIVFVVMWILPFVFLSREGRKFIGMRKIKSLKWIFYSFLLGAIASVTVYLLGDYFYQDTLHNWFVYMAQPFYKDLNETNRLVLFIISAIIGMTFSPIGEELLYRGLVHGSFQTNLGEEKSSFIDSAAFGITHLAHFGIIYVSGKWEFLLIPSLLWVILMFLTSRLFFICKKRTGSIMGAIVSHAGFNLVMMYIIFYHIL